MAAKLLNYSLDLKKSTEFYESSKNPFGYTGHRFRTMAKV